MSLFHVLLIFFECVARNFDFFRWEAEYRIQDLQKQTSPRNIGLGGPLLTSLAASNEWQTAALRPRSLLWAMTQFCELAQFVIEQLEKYKDATNRLSAVEYEQLRDALMLQKSLINGHKETIERLLYRIETSMDVARTLLVERDNEIMKAISVITMIFLPATFAATFFSMVFFHVGDEQNVKLIVDKNIWLYFVVTVPFTLLVGAWHWKGLLEYLFRAWYFVTGSKKIQVEQQPGGIAYEYVCFIYCSVVCVIPLSAN